MADATTVVEGKIKFREGKKWKPRWCIFKKPSPVADQLQVVLYKDVCQAVKDEAKPKNIFVLEAFFGLDAGIAYDKEAHVLAIICQKSICLMAFEQRENMIQFEIKIRQSLGEEHQFPVTVVKAPSSSRLLKDQVRLVIHDLRFCLVAFTPPKILLSWNIEDLRRFGATDNKFCFEGGSRCGKGTGVFALQSEQAKDIEDIVHLASIGKMSNVHRKFKNRSSQVDLSSHLIADMLPSHSSSYIHHHQSCSPKSPPQAQLPVTLNCCYDSQTGSAESEDWSWYKRHSVSVMDHHRIVASRDNKDQFMGIYDVPPNHGRQLVEHACGKPEESNYAVPRSYPEAPPQDGSFLSNDYSNYKQIVTNGKDVNDSSSKEPQDKCVDFFNLKVDKLTRKSPSPSVSREESLQRLKIQESDLQREMVLLDEILQKCVNKNQEKSFETVERNNACPAVNQSRLNKSDTIDFDDSLTIISGNIAPFQMKIDKPHAPSRIDRAMVVRLNTSMPEGMPESPLGERKVKNILAPLPYVNLSRYDDESYSHVHFPGSADSLPLVKDSGHLGLDNKHLKLRGQSSSLINLNTTVSLSHSSVEKNSRKPLNSEPLIPYQVRPNKQGSSNDNTQEILIVKLDDSTVSNLAAHSPLQYVTCTENLDLNKNNSDLVKVFTSDSVRSMADENYVNCEAIYENLPIKIDTDYVIPPELPPKGPALLKKLQAASFNRQMVNHANEQHSYSQCFSKNHNAGHDGHLNIALHDTEQDKKLDMKEDNYCMMGSPKIRHKLSVVPESPFKSTRSHNIQNQLKNFDEHARSDYMDMGVYGSDGREDEIYLDVAAKDLYISEADLKLKNYDSNMGGESAYMDMSCVPNRKSIVIPNLDSINPSNKVTTRETTKHIQRPNLGPAPPPPCPPRPLSLKIRQRSDNSPTINVGLIQEVRSNQNSSQPIKSSTKVYTKVKKNNNSSPSEPPMPFPNLIEFTKKMSESRSTYVNTFIDSNKYCSSQDSNMTSRDVLLPEPVKEGFLARLKRRSSKEKNALQLQDKGNKNRNSILERSMSEHETSKVIKDEKTSKLKLGRRRSSSFPNRLSYQESLDSTNVTALSQVVGSFSSFTSNSSKSNSTAKQADQSESSSSIQDFSDDSDLSPLLKSGEKKLDCTALTVLHVHQSSASLQYPYMQISKSLSMQGGSSKTDDEKIIEMFEQKKSFNKPVIYQRSSSLELKNPNTDSDQTYFLKLPKPYLQSERRFSFEKSAGCNNAPSSCMEEGNSHPENFTCHQNDDRLITPTNDEHLPPCLPPKLKNYQVPLSPVLESSPHIPGVREPIYVELDEVVNVSKNEKAMERKEHSHPDRETRRLSSGENVCPPYKVSALTIPVDVVRRSGADNFTVLWSQRSITCQNFLDNSLECTHPAKTVLRPRSGQEYVLIKRKAKLLTTSHLNSACNQFFTFDLDHNDALSVLSSLSTPQNSPSFSSADNTMKRVYPDLWFAQPAAMSSYSSLNLLYHNQSSSTVKDSACKTELTGDVFFPADALFNSSPLPSPYQQKSSLSPQVHYPIYVNQEFTRKHQHPLTSYRTMSTSSSQSSISPSRTSMLSLMSSLLSPKQSSGEVYYSQQQKNLGLRQSEPVPGKFDNLSFSLPRSQGPTFVSSSSKGAKHCPDLYTSDNNKVLNKEYDKFANSVIIARRRNQCPAFIPEDHQPTEPLSSSHLLQLPQVKSSGYKNIDSFNSSASTDNSALTEFTSSSSFTLPRSIGRHPSSDVNSNRKTSVSYSEMSSVFTASQHLPDMTPLSVCDEFSNNRDSLPYLCNPPPPVRRRHASTSSSSVSSSPSLTPVDSSDSPPSYYAPSPPYTPPALPIISSPPAIPPRKRLLPPAPIAVPSSPSERATDSSDDEPELNYIEVDMSKASNELNKSAQLPAVYYRPNKRTQKKEKDSAKLRYVEIDHRATKALQEARQEHVQARDGTQLSRINSAPASSKKKHFTFISRERKLSSGSIESC
ncbi:hypothetical protein Btru_035509 [Bulinus truncatus]|nr:hypothetical protein Btru_035509 [Bulinus truncatus]